VACGPFVARAQLVVLCLAERRERKACWRWPCGTGLQVMAAMFDEDVTRLRGPDGKGNTDRAR
jgi:hypothetical protein